MDISEMFQNAEQKFLLESLERLRNASRMTTDEEILRIISNSSSINDDSYYSRPVEFLLIILYSILAVIGFGLNMFMTCVIIFSKKLMRNPSNLLVLNLMTSDLLMVIFCVPFTLMSLVWKSWIFGRAMCKLIPFLQSVSIIVCSATIAMIAIDRLIRVTKNISTNSYHAMFARTHWIMISLETACIWIFALVTSSPIAFYQFLITMSVKSSTIFSKCMEIWPQESYKGMYAITNMMIQFFLPTFILIYSNIMIKRHLEGNLSGLDTSVVSKSMKSTRVTIGPSSPSSSNNLSDLRMPSSTISFFRLFSCHLSGNNPVTTNVTSESLSQAGTNSMNEHSSSNNNQLNPRKSTITEHSRSDTISRNRSLLMKEMKRNQQVTRTLFSIVLSFTITWLPWNLFNIYLDFAPTYALPVESTYLILAFCYLVAMLTIPVNAFMYGWANPAIRGEALAVLGLLKRAIVEEEPPIARQVSSTRAIESDDRFVTPTRIPVRSASA